MDSFRFADFSSKFQQRTPSLYNILETIYNPLSFSARQYVSFFYQVFSSSSSSSPLLNKTHISFPSLPESSSSSSSSPSTTSYGLVVLCCVNLHEPFSFHKAYFSFSFPFSHKLPPAFVLFLLLSLFICISAYIYSSRRSGSIFFSFLFSSSSSKRHVAYISC